MNNNKKKEILFINKIFSENKLKNYFKKNFNYIKLFFSFHDTRILFKHDFLRKIRSYKNIEKYIKEYLINLINRLNIKKMNLTNFEKEIFWNIFEYVIDGYKNINLKTILIKSWVKNSNNKKWVIIVHGLNSHKFRSIFFGLVYLRLGYNIMVFDQRNHGESSKSITTMGWYEKEDLLKIFLFLNKHEFKNIDEINFYGWSMGSFVIMEFLKKYYNFSNKIKWVIIDSVISNLKKLYFYYIKKLNINYSEQYYAIRNYCIFNRGYDPEKINPGENLQKLSKIPILFFLNEKDSITPIKMGEEAFKNKYLFEKNKISKKIILKCEHVKGIYKYSVLYINYIINFIKNL